MGDNIVHNGMIRKIAEDYPDHQIFTGSKPHNFENVKYMYRDDNNISVISCIDDGDLHNHVNFNNYDKVISTHFGDGCKYNYDIYFDDSFYLSADIDTEVKTKYFKLNRDEEIENKVYKELIEDRGITDYIFLHEKPQQRVLIDRDKLNSNLPIIFADTKYGIFELLKVIENAKSVHIISSSFLSLMMCKQYNKNTYAHMYCDRTHISPYIEKCGIKVIL